ncbi:MAG: UvrD-helicase domain-containing protein [Planctomycetes bacterium]|nr:UvrD-helicase domain-containing protein [Planctomycetota bacterium]
MIIELDRHAVVEASAGAGKTYAIQELVVRLLAEAKADIQKILVVTYTEKATGELRERIRKTLEDKLRKAPEHRAIWQRALDEFDQAPIFTIHGFCQRLLREYAFEQGQDFRGELVDDRNLLEPLLRDIQRRQWRQEYGPRLRTALDIAQYDRQGAEKWENRVRDLARDYRPERGHRLLPEVPAPDTDALEVEKTFRAKIVEIRKLAGMPGAKIDGHPWIAGMEASKIHAGARKRRVTKLVVPILEWLQDDEILVHPLTEFLALERQVTDEFYDDPLVDFEALYHKDADRDKVKKACPALAKAESLLEELQKLGRKFAFTEELSVRTVGHLHEELARRKRERGLYSYEDLIVNADRALDPTNPDAAHLAAILRERFQYAVVDEFQDTDSLQWRIFQRLFLEVGPAQVGPASRAVPMTPEEVRLGSRDLQGSPDLQGAGRLFVVGDPKQAIFGFRSADLPTYLRAVDEMREIYGAKRHSLTTNWRSVPELIDSLNQLFEKGNWFKPESKIRYERVEPPAGHERINRLEDDVTARPAISLVDWRKGGKLSDCARKHARFIAREIRRLLEARVEIVVKKERRILHEGDIAALVFRRNEALALVAALQDRHIPYTFYKQAGLWDSEEAKHIALVLEAIARPDDRGHWHKALLTRFFRLRPKDLALCEETPSRHAARRLMQRWIVLAEKREWSALCQTLLDDTGVLFHDCDAPGYDRRLSNYRHLLGRLQEWGYRESLDLSDLLELFRNRRAQVDEAEADVQPIETEARKVQILTVHASKGLEFPVVFLAGGFTQGNRNRLYARYRDDADREVFDLRPDSEAKRRVDEQREQEDRRLLYVALTRAMLKLYVPLVERHQGQAQHQGPACKILAPALKDAKLEERGEPFAAVVDPEAMPPMKAPIMPPSKTDRGADAAVHGPLAISEPVFRELPADLNKRRIRMHSFSSLHRAESRRWHEGEQFGESRPRAADEDSDAVEDPLRGPVLGEIVHEILEAINFTEVGKAADAAALLEMESIRRAMDGPIARHLPKLRTRVPRTSLEESCRKLVAGMVWGALRTPLPGLDGNLSAIPKSDRLAELEFQYPLTAGDEAPPETRLGDGFITGFMDLVFRKNELFFLLDWKSNWLDAYDDAALARAMEMSGYHRQYRLYLEALKRWMTARHGPDFDFSAKFGGVYYLFVRGMTGQENSPGVFFHKADVRGVDA